VKLDENLFCKKHLKAGNIIIEEGTIGDEMFLLVKGSVQVSKKTSKNEEIKINQQHAGEFLGELSLILDKKRTASVYCLTDVTLIEIKKDSFFSITNAIPQLTKNVAKIIAGRLRTSDYRSVSEVSRSMDLLKLNKKISEQKNELSELNATKDKFFSIIAHDLKSPFNSLLGFSNLLIEEFDNLPKDNLRKFASNIHQSADSLFKLLNNLLQWSQAQTGRIEYLPQKTDLYALINSIITLLTPNADEKQIRLVSNIAENEIAFLDENMVKTVFRNLVNNAIKFSSPGGEIRIENELLDNFIELSVIDYGVGIKKEDSEKLFMLDIKHSTTGTSGEKGTGLGLILCKEFVERHGGEIWVESEFGKGSKFKFTLPKAKLEFEDK
jgi:signal transduction histidine kinase